MGVGWTGVRHDVGLRRADDLWLSTEHRQPFGTSQGEVEERSVRGKPVKARHARRVAPESLEETRHPFLEVRRFEVSSVGGWALDDVREAHPDAWKLSSVLGAEGVGTQRPPTGPRQVPVVERRPEPPRRT